MGNYARAYLNVGVRVDVDELQELVLNLSEETKLDMLKKQKSWSTVTDIDEFNEDDLDAYALVELVANYLNLDSESYGYGPGELEDQDYVFISKKGKNYSVDWEEPEVVDLDRVAKDLKENGPKLEEALARIGYNHKAEVILGAYYG